MIEQEEGGRKPTKHLDGDANELAIVKQVRERYAEAAVASRVAGRIALEVLEKKDEAGSCCRSDAIATDLFGSTLYSSLETSELPIAAVAASLGCGNPLAVADLRPGEHVLDLGSGGGIDVLLSAKRVGPTGFVYGVDLTDEMLTLAEENRAEAGVTNVRFLKGRIEDVPLPDGSVDVVISNCVINLSVDKAMVIAEMFRVLTPGGRLGISDVVAEDRLTPRERAERGSWAGCVAGALSRGEYLAGLGAAGFVDAEVSFTNEAADGMHTAIVRATKPSSPRSQPVAAAGSPSGPGAVA